MVRHVSSCASRTSAQLLDAPLVHHDDAVGHRLRLFLVVRHHDGGHAQALVQAADFEPQIGPHPGIKRA